MLKTRPHFIFVLESSLKLSAILLVFYVAAIFMSTDRSYTAVTSLLYMLGAFAMVFLYFWFFWRKTSVHVEKNTLAAEFGLGRKNTIAVPLSEIRKVEIKTSLLQKLTKTAHVWIDGKNISGAVGGEASVLQSQLVLRQEDAQALVSYIKENRKAARDTK